MKHENHQFVEMGGGKTKGNMSHKDVMCADCGMKKRLHEDGRMETMSDGSMPKEKEMHKK